jgi:hypothetical protein
MASVFRAGLDNRFHENGLSRSLWKRDVLRNVHNRQMRAGRTGRIWSARGYFRWSSIIFFAFGTMTENSVL